MFLIFAMSITLFVCPVSAETQSYQNEYLEAEKYIANIDFNNDGKLNFLVNSLSLYANNGDERKFSKLNDIIAEQLNIYYRRFKYSY